MSTPPTPVVFIHGLWPHSTSWHPWVELFRSAGYDPIAPGWPNEPDTVQDSRDRPDLVADTSIDDAAAHFTKLIDAPNPSPIIAGHSFGGLLAEKLLGHAVGRAAVAIDPAQIKGVLPLPLAQLRAAFPALGSPADLHKSVSLTRTDSASASATPFRQRNQTHSMTNGPSPRRPDSNSAPPQPI